MSQPTFPTQPSPTPEGISAPPSVPASRPVVPPIPAPPAEPVPVPPVELDTVPKAELFAVPQAGPIPPESAPPSPPQPSPWPTEQLSQPGVPSQQPYAPGQQPNAPSQPYMPVQQPYTPNQPYAPEQQPYASGQQPYAPSQQPYAPGQQQYASGQSYPAGQPYVPNQQYTLPQPYAAGGPPQTTAPKKKTWLIVLIIVLAVLLVGGAGFFAYWHFTTRDDGVEGGRPEDGPVTAGQAKTAQAAVRGFLEALARGDSADALSFAATPTDPTFLTDEVLAESLALNPITFQQAVREDLSDTEYVAVTADYQIGSQSVNTIYETVVQDGYYFIDQVTAPISLYGVYVSGIGMRLNGVSISTSALTPYLDLFPGSYELTIGNSMLTLLGGQFVVTDPLAYPDLLDTRVDLAPDTLGQLATAASTKLDECMAETTLTSHCGIGLPLVISDGKIRDIDPNSIQWSFITGTSDFPADSFQYDPQSDPTEARAPADVQVRRTMHGEGDDAQYIFYLCYDISSVYVDFSRPDSLDVSFTSTGDTNCPSPQR